MKASPSSVGVVLVDAHAVVRAGLGLLVASEPDIDVIAEAGTADEALSGLRRFRSRNRIVVVIGLEISGERDAFWLIRSIRDQYPTLPILACGGDIDGMTISQALFVGADGFVHKNTEPARFLEAIRRTAAGQVVMEGLPRGTFGDLADSLDRQRAAEHILTQREREVLCVAAEGLTARQIGRRLGVQERTVTTHLARIYRKLGANSRIGAIAAATRSGVMVSPIGMGPAGNDNLPLAALAT
jgi:DNA-binding NarL/FixJ family response regulator